MNPFNLGSPAPKGYKVTIANTATTETNPHIRHFNNQEREFEEKFEDKQIFKIEGMKGTYKNTIYWNSIRSFLRTSYLTHLKETRARLEGKRKKLPLHINVEIDAIDAVNSIRNQGFNSCLDQEIRLLDEAINYIEKRV